MYTQEQFDTDVNKMLAIQITDRLTGVFSSGHKDFLDGLHFVHMIREIDQITRTKSFSVKYTVEHMAALKQQYANEFAVLDQIRTWQQEGFSFMEMLLMLKDSLQDADDPKKHLQEDQTLPMDRPIANIKKEEFDGWLLMALRSSVRLKLKNSSGERFADENTDQIIQNLHFAHDLIRNRKRTKENTLPDESVENYKKTYPGELEILNQIETLLRKRRSYGQIQAAIIPALRELIKIGQTLDPRYIDA